MSDLALLKGKKILLLSFLPPSTGNLKSSGSLRLISSHAAANRYMKITQSKQYLKQKNSDKWLLEVRVSGLGRKERGKLDNI